MSSLTVQKYEREFFLGIFNKIEASLTDEQNIIITEIKNKALKLYNKNNDNYNEKNNDNKYSKSSDKGSWRKAKPSLISKDISEEDKIKNNITCLLNKLSPTNFDNISVKVDKILSENELLEHTVNEIFKKAVYQPIYCPFYVKLLLMFCEKNYDIDGIISDMCEKFTNIINNSKNKEDANQSYDEFCKSNKIKQFKLGYSQFIGELYNKNLILFEFIEIFIEELIYNIFKLYDIDINDLNIENNIIAVCKIINTCYDKNKDIVKDKSKFNDIYNLNISKKLKFKIQDILELN